MFVSEAVPSYPLAPIGGNNLLINEWAAAENDNWRDPGCAPPSRNAKYQGLIYPWDSAFNELIWARSGLPSHIAAAQSEAKVRYVGQLEKTGCLPNQMRINGGAVGLEGWLNGSKEHSNYGQPTLGAISGLELFDATERQNTPRAKIEAFAHASSIYDNLAGEASYFPLYRTHESTGSLVHIIRSEESGMDELPIFDSLFADATALKRRPGRKPEDETPGHLNAALNMAIHFAGRMAVARKMRGTEQDTERARDIFCAYVVQMQCIVTANCYAMAELARKLGKTETEINKFSAMGHAIEDQVLSDLDADPEKPGMWDPTARDGQGMFRDLGRDGKPIVSRGRFGREFEEKTISNLFGILLPGVKEHQLSSTIDLAFEEFVHEHGLSTVGRSSPNYDIDHREKETGRWRTPSWMNVQWLLAEGLLTQINRQDLSPQVIDKCRQLLNHICDTSIGVLNKWAEEGKPLPEYWNPKTGDGFRLWRVVYFAWTNLGYVMPPDTNPSVFAKALLKQQQHQLATF